MLVEHVHQSTLHAASMARPKENLKQQPFGAYIQFLLRCLMCGTPVLCHRFLRGVMLPLLLCVAALRRRHASTPWRTYSSTTHHSEGEREVLSATCCVKKASQHHQGHVCQGQGSCLIARHYFVQSEASDSQFALAAGSDLVHLDAGPVSVLMSSKVGQIRV